MLDKFRSLSQTWVAKVLLALIMIPFALFGMQYYLHQSGGSGGVVKIDGETVSRSEFEQGLRNQQQRLEEGQGKVDPALLDSPQVRYETMNALINRHLLLRYGQDHHLVVPDEMLVDEISRIEPFQEQGRFSQSRYERVLKAQGMTPALFEARLREDLEVQIQQMTLTNSEWIPEASVTAFLQLAGQQRSVAVSQILPGTYLGQVKVSSDEMRHEYQAHPEAFRVPARVKVQYLELSADTLASQVTVTPAELEAAWRDPANESHKASPETRRASHILIAVAAEATPAQRQAAHAKAEAVLAAIHHDPSRFEALARSDSQDPGSAAQGGDLGYFGRGSMTPRFEKAVFAMKPGEITGPVETRFGYHLIKLTDVRPGHQPTLEEMTPTLTEQLKKQQAAQLFSDRAEAFSNLVYEQSASLDPAAAKLGLKIQQSDWVTQGSGGAGVLANPKLVDALFTKDALDGHRNTNAIEVAPNVLVAAHVSASEPARTLPFDEVSHEIENRLKAQAAARQARQVGEAELADLKAGKPVAATFSPVQSLTRQQAFGNQFPGPVINAIFKASPEHLPAYAGGETPEGGYVLVRVDGVTPGASDAAARTPQITVGLGRAYADEVMGEFMAGLRHGATIQVLDQGVLGVQKNRSGE